MLSQHNYNNAGTTFRLIVVLHSFRNPLGSSWPFAVCCLLPFVSLKARCIITYCCFSSYCSGIASTWTPLRFAKCSEIMHPTNIGYSDMNVAFQRWNTRSLEWPKSFIKVVLMSSQDCLWVLILLVALSHPVCSLMTMWPLAEGGQRWSQLKRKKKKKREIAQIAVRCRMLNDAHAPLGVHSTWQVHVKLSVQWEGCGNQMCQKQRFELQAVKVVQEERTEGIFWYFMFSCRELDDKVLTKSVETTVCYFMGFSLPGYSVQLRGGDSGKRSRKSWQRNNLAHKTCNTLGFTCRLLFRFIKQDLKF